MRASGIITLSYEAGVREAVFAARFEREAFPEVHYRRDVQRMTDVLPMTFG